MHTDEAMYICTLRQTCETAAVAPLVTSHSVQNNFDTHKVHDYGCENSQVELMIFPSIFPIYLFYFLILVVKRTPFSPDTTLIATKEQLARPLPATLFLSPFLFLFLFLFLDIFATTPFYP